MRLARIGILFSAAGLLCGCGITAIRPYASSLTVRVVGERKADVEEAAGMLKSSGVFRVVTSDLDKPADITVTVLGSYGSIRCGTPQMMTYFTLGLVPTGNGFRARLVLSVSGIESAEAVQIEPEVVANTKHGLWALPLRISKHWTRFKDDDPANLSARLREELLSHESALLALVRKGAA